VRDDTPRESALIEAAPLAPAGRSETMGGAERARRGAYRYRFGVIYFLLAAVVGGAVGSFVVLVTRDGPPASARWSQWQPDGSETARTRQIADHVSRGYRQPNGEQLVFAIGGPPQINVPDQGVLLVPDIVVQPDTSRGQREEGDFDRYAGDSAVAYRLCGTGQSCAIGEGTPSATRLQLLRREALELSLYTFKYGSGVDSVVVFLPPPPPAADGSQDTSGALFLRRNDVRSELDRPLSATLPAPAPITVANLTSGEAATVDRLTQPHLYSYAYQQSQNGSPVLVLAPSTAG
jgi:hypothetical protein